MIDYRPFTESDETQCLDLILRCIDDFEGIDKGGLAKLREHIRRKPCREYLLSVFCLVAVADGHIVGIGALDSQEIKRMYVDPSRRRQGIGRAIYDRLEAEARRRGISSLRLDASMNAVAFYERLGFVPQQEKAWCLDGFAIRNLLMTKELPHEQLPNNHPHAPNADSTSD